jgi:hypothetical protein
VLEGTRDGVNWEPITTLTTDADGNASVTYRPANNLYYRGVFGGTPELGAVTSNTARFVVRHELLRPTANGETKVVSRGRKVTFSTTVAVTRRSPERQGHVHPSANRWQPTLSPSAMLMSRRRRRFVH